MDDKPDIITPVISERAEAAPAKGKPAGAFGLHMPHLPKISTPKWMRVISGKEFFKPLMATCALTAWAGLCGLGGWGVWASQGLPDTSDMWTEKRPASVTFVDRYDREILVRGSRPTKPVNLALLPDHLPDALMAIEDRRYRYHPGFDPVGLTRALYANHKAGRVVQGGSTLSQQLAKNLFLTPERNMKRKSQELMLAMWLEHKFTKDQILELYLGRVYFGAGAWGVDAAAERYFAKPAADLTLGESAMLAGLLKAPSNYNPAVNASRTASRTTTVLSAMAKHGFITPEDKASAFASIIEVEPPEPQSSAHYFTDWIWDDLIALIGEPEQDIIVHTTLDLTAQSAADAAVSKHLNAKRGATQAAVISMDGTGGVRAMLGGTDYTSSQFNRAIQAKRQPGSAFKPFVYMAALKSGVKPWDQRIDGPVVIDDWEPTNFSNEFSGQVSVAKAFAKSLNTVAVMLSEEAGRDAVVDTAAQMGLGGLSPLRSIALGAQETTPLDLTEAYLPFANWGYRQSAYGITEIYTPSGTLIHSRRAPQAARVISGDLLRDMNMMMHMTVQEGTAKRARIPGRELAGKTGTTNDYRDAWFVGYAPDYVTGVWIGNDENTAMRRVTGGSIPASIWHDVMEPALKTLPQSRLPKAAVPIRTANDNALGNLLSDIESNLE